MLPSLWHTLQPQGSQRLYALIDAAAHTHIHAHIEAWQPPSIALHPPGFDLPDEAAPWLVHLKPGNTFSEWYLQEGFLLGWGIVLHSTHKMLILAEQLIPWLVAQQTDTQQRLLIRFYDPVIIQAYLSLLSSVERAQILNGISGIWRPVNVAGIVEHLIPTETGLMRQTTDLRTLSIAQEEPDESRHADL